MKYYPRSTATLTTRNPRRSISSRRTRVSLWDRRQNGAPRPPSRTKSHSLWTTGALSLFFVLVRDCSELCVSVHVYTSFILPTSTHMCMRVRLLSKYIIAGHASQGSQRQDHVRWWCGRVRRQPHARGTMVLISRWIKFKTSLYGLCFDNLTFYILQFQRSRISSLDICGHSQLASTWDDD